MKSGLAQTAVPKSVSRDGCHHHENAARVLPFQRSGDTDFSQQEALSLKEPSCGMSGRLGVIATEDAQQQ
ncbi:MAG: hypothetical protein WA117_20800 [Verrucomicrobiia bacterium]